MTVKEKETTAQKTFITAGETTAEDVKAFVEAKVKAAVDQAQAQYDPQIAGPALWWDMYAYGPLVSFMPNGPLPPNQILKVGTTAYITTVLMLNPNPILPPAPGISPADLLSSFSLPFAVTYQTGNVTTWTPAEAALNVTHAGALVPGVNTYFDVLTFTPSVPGLLEMSISARILGNLPAPLAPQFAGFARYVYDFDPEELWAAPAPGWQFDTPIRMMVYA